MESDGILPRVVIRTRTLWRALLACALLLWLGNLAAGLLMYGGHMAYGHFLHLLLSFNLERNLPTFFSGCLFLLNALLFYGKGAAARAWSRERVVWLLLAVLCLFLAADELFMIHEKLVRPVRQALDLGGLLYFSWVVVYGAAVLVLAALLLPFWWSMPARQRIIYLAGAVVYLFGALGVEMLGGRHLEMHGGRNFAYFLLFTAEESMEIAGLLLTTWAQLLRSRSVAPSRPGTPRATRRAARARLGGAVPGVAACGGRARRLLRRGA